MFSAWMIMLAAGNLSHHFNDPKWLVGYWFCVPFGILIDVTIGAQFRKGSRD